MLFNYKQGEGIIPNFINEGENSLNSGETKKFLTKIFNDGSLNPNAKNYIDDEFLDEYLKFYDDVDKKAIQYVKDVRDGNIALKDGVSILDGYKKQFSIFSKLGKVFGNLGATILNGLVSNLIMQGISLLISKANELRKSLGWLTKGERIKIADDIKQAGETARAEISNIDENFKNHEKTVSDIKDRYIELSKGVHDLGLSTQSQGALSTDEYNEFLDISKQLVDIFPSLNGGLSNEGDQLTTLNGSASTISSTLEVLLQQERELAGIKLGDQMPKIWEGYGQAVNDASNEYNEARDNLLKYQQLFNDIQNASNSDMTWDQFELAYPNNYEELSKVFEESGLGNFDDYLNSNVSKEQVQDALDTYFRNLLSQYQNEMDSASSIIETENSKLADSIITYMSYTNSKYNNLGDNKDIVNGIIRNIGYDTAYSGMRSQDDWEKVYGNISNKVLNDFSKLDEDTSQKLHDMYSKLFNFEDSEMTLQEYEDTLYSFRNFILANFADVDTRDAILNSLPDDQAIQDKITHLKELMGSNWKDEYLKEFTAQELEIALELTLDGKSYQNVEERLAQLGVGGNVNLNLRPEISGTELNKVGWDVDDNDYATVYSSTYSNAEGTKYVNFTPIIVDPETGKYRGVMSPTALQEYAEGVIDGTKTDHLNLQIGAEFKTKEAAEKAANEIHNLHQLKAEGEIDFNTDAFDFDGVKKAIEDKINPIEIETEVKVSASDAVDSMADAKTAVTSLNELYNQTVNNATKVGQKTKRQDANGNVTEEIDNNLAMGYADPALINTVETSFKNFIKTASDSGKDVESMNLALHEFEETLVKYPNDADKAQSAINNLITAYIDQTDIIQNLTEENAEWSEAQLTAMGITNAHQVVQSRLNKVVKETQINIATLAKKVQEYNDAIDDGKDGTDKIASMVSDVQKALTMYGENGEEIQAPTIDDSFVQAHMEDIQAMAAGDIDALNRVRLAAAQRAVMEVTINVPSEVAEHQIAGLMDMVAQADAMNIDVGATIDDSAFIAALNSMIKATGMTADQVNAAFSSMGYSVQFKEHKYATQLVKSANFDKLPSSVQQQIRAMSFEYNVPEVEFIAKKGSTGSGVGAKYGGSPKSSSGGSGGGGGGGGGSNSGSEPNKPKEESEESFDWIEVAIQRIEEEIARLDKVVGNSYDLWTHRNSALLKELEKTKEEIKAQQIAQSEYLRNANAVKVNNGKGLNPDDYGENDQLVKAADQKLLDEARKAWATGEYQRKVREGKMTGDDIEKIQNHFLSDTIKFYQELYEKSVAAGDAVQDLKIKLGDLARTNFDNLKTEFEETLSYFESYSSLIDERISRTEEKGYFVSKKYYNDLVNYEKKSIDTLKKEYDGLIKKRDEAVANGYIASGSEEWHSLNQEILDVAKSIEEANTKLVEYGNTMRQIDWDVFDYERERIEKMNEEFDFLIDLLDNQKLYDDFGIFNSRGWADTALHASKYNVYMQQSLDYAKERAKIEKELAKDNADKNLIERREELIQLQQESIQNAYAEKEAVKSLVEEGKYLLSINLFNCGKPLRANILQRKDEICLDVNVIKNY